MFMNQQVLFIQGGGNDGYEADSSLVAALRDALGEAYEVIYPRLDSDEAAADFGWLRQIGEQISALGNNVMLAGHSLGASMLLKYLSENAGPKKVRGIFLLATPFWAGDEDW